MIAPHHFYIMYYVYLLKSQKDSKLYTGVTNDLRRRLLEHNSGRSKSTANRRPFKLVYYEAYQAKEDANLRERKLKRYNNGYKELMKRLSKSLLI